MIYFHKHNNLLSAINEKCIVLNRNNHKYYEPLFIDFTEAKIIEDDDFLLDIYAFGLLSLQILLGRNIKEEILEMTNYQSEYKNILISSLPILLEFIPYQHYNNCIDFFQNLFCVNTRNTNDIYHHSLFKEFSIVNNHYDNHKISINGVIEFSEHRNIIKLMIYWIQQILGESDISLLFLTIDIFNKASINYKSVEEDPTGLGCESVERMKLSIASIYIVVKLYKLNISKEEIILKISNELPNVTSADIDVYSNKVVILLDGILCDSSIYHCCKNVNQLMLCFNDIILNNDSMIYFNNNIDELVSKNNDQSNCKNISIDKFFL